MASQRVYYHVYYKYGKWNEDFRLYEGRKIRGNGLACTEEQLYMSI